MDETLTILIVDSNVGFAGMLKQSLEQDCDYSATVAHAGEEALEIASEKRFDLAIVDLGLGAEDGLDGEAVARRLRDEQAQLRLMLIPVRGDDLPDQLSDLDVQGVLPKPFFLPDLPDLLDAALTKPVQETPRAAEVGRSETTASLPARAQRAATWRGGSRRVVHQLEVLAHEVDATAVIMSRGDKVLGSVGRLDPEEVSALAQIVSQACEMSKRSARVVGRDQQEFELSFAGEQHTLYALTVVGDVLISVVLPYPVAVGFLRHRAKETVGQLHKLLSGR